MGRGLTPRNQNVTFQAPGLAVTRSATALSNSESLLWTYGSALSRTIANEPSMRLNCTNVTWASFNPRCLRVRKRNRPKKQSDNGFAGENSLPVQESPREIRSGCAPKGAQSESTSIPHSRCSMLGAGGPHIRDKYPRRCPTRSCPSSHSTNNATSGAPLFHLQSRTSAQPA